MIASRVRGRLVAGALAAGSVCLLSADQGGFFSPAWHWATLALATVAALGLVLRERIEISRPQAALVVGLALLAGWTALSTVWSEEPASSVAELDRSLVYVAGMLAVLVLADRVDGGSLLVGTLVGIGGICAYSLLDRLVRGVRPQPWEGDLLQRPLGYANALGALAAVGLVLLVGLVASQRRRSWWLVAAAGAAVFIPVLVLTRSRGSVLVVIPGLALMAGLRYGRHRLALLAAALPLLVLAGALVAPAGSHASALSSSLGPRAYYWQVGWRQTADHPLLGTGAGTFEVAWLEHGSFVVAGATRDAHSLYLETLGELGPVGLALVLATLALPLVAAFRQKPASGMTAAGAGAFLAFLLHAGIDWDWEMPAVTLAGLLCGAALLVGADGGILVRSRQRWILLAVALTLVGLALRLLVRHGQIP